MLMGPKGVEWKVLGVGPQEPIAAGKRRHVMVDVEATEEEVRGTSTLMLWSHEGDGGGEPLDAVRFP
jgi:hypothetical protein